MEKIVTKKVILNPKYEPLYKLGTRYCVITGGRGSAKSFSVSVYLLLKTFEEGKTILFTRLTMTSAEISIIPEFWEKVELMGMEGMFHKTQNSIENLQTGSKILFRGLKSSSGNNTANLKSINNITIWVLDEAEEMIDETMFDKIDLSLRKKDEQCEVIMVMNPPDNKKHFMFRKFYGGYGLANVHNGVVGNCTFIHTTYLDNIRNLNQTFLDLAENCKKVDPEKYNNIYLGLFGEQSEKLVYKNWRIASFPSHLPCWYGVDWGFTNDPTAVVRVAYDKSTMSVYLHEVLYQKEIQPRDVARAIKEDFKNKQTQIYKDENVDLRVENQIIFANDKSYSLESYLENAAILDHLGIDRAFYDKELKRINQVGMEVYCDPARPEHISELRKGYNIQAMGAINANKQGRIEFLKYFNVYYTRESVNLRKEVETYEWLVDRHDKTKITNTPKDGDDHLMDAVNYGAVTHLRRLGVMNLLGEK